MVILSRMFSLFQIVQDVRFKIMCFLNDKLKREKKSKRSNKYKSRIHALLILLMLHKNAGKFITIVKLLR